MDGAAEGIIYRIHNSQSVKKYMWREYIIYQDMTLKPLDQDPEETEDGKARKKAKRIGEKSLTYR